MPYHALVIDDEPSIRALIVSVLADDGWTAAEAGDGLEGLRRLEREAVDAIVLDLDMPVMDGRSFYRQMRLRGPQVPTLVLSAYGAKAAAHELGAEAALQKPFDVDEFSQVMDVLAQGSRPTGDTVRFSR